MDKTWEPADGNCNFGQDHRVTYQRPLVVKIKDLEEADISPVEDRLSLLTRMDISSLSKLGDYSDGKGVVKLLRGIRSLSLSEEEEVIK